MPAMRLRGRVLPTGERQELWVDNGRISFTPIAGARTLISEGYVLPGLVDAHCHPGIGEKGPVTLAEAANQARVDRDAGTLLIRDCGVPIDTRALQRRLDLPRIIRCGRHLALAKRYLPGFGIELADPSLLPAAVAGQAADGDGWVKLVGDWIDRSVGELTPLWPEDILRDAIAVAHAAGAKVTAHVFGHEALPGLINAGIDCLEHGTGLSTELIDEVARRQIAVVPTLINIENFPSIADRATKYPRYAAHMRALHANVRKTIGAAIEAGVPMYAGSDAGSMIAHGRLVDEVQALHQAGMSREQALGAASWAARSWLGHEGLTDEASADLLIFDSDPRVDLEVLRHPKHVLLRGRVVW